MKKVLFLIVSVLILALLVTGCSEISNVTAPGGTAVDNLSRFTIPDNWSAYDMWKGQFVRSNPDILLKNGLAGGEVKINYVKGQKAYMVDIQAYGFGLEGFDPDASYGVWLMTNKGFDAIDMNSCGGNHLLLGDLIVDEDGFGKLHVNGYEGIEEYLDNASNIRVNIYERPISSGSWILTTSAPRYTSEPDFEPVDSNREE